MSKISTQLNLLHILMDERIHASKELEEKLELKNSTIRFYINNLILAGFHVESFRGKGGGYKLDKNMCVNVILKMIDKNKKQ